MKWLAKIWQELSGRYRAGFLICIISSILFFMATLLNWFAIKDLYDQQAAKRWSQEDDYAQLSCFYPSSMQPTDYDFQSLYHSIEKELINASMEKKTENAKLFVDAYSVSGTLSLSSENSSMEVKAVGVTDHFFLFHPVTLLAGAYFDEAMLMKDGIILDEEAAFILYGSNDVVGMPVYIGNKPYYIRGVIEREDGYFAKKAGLDTSVCFVYMETLLQHGGVDGSYTYEILMPNPVDGFAKNILTTALADTKQQIEIIENNTRYSINARKEILMNFGIRSMSRNGIIYPYWENIARAKEDVSSMILIVQVIFAVTALAFIIWYVRRVYKNRTWNIKTIFNKIRRAK